MKKSGLTLLELIMVISMIAVLSVGVAPPFLRAVPEINLKMTANNIAGDLKFARSSAIKRQETVGLFFNIADRTYAIIANGNDGLADTPDDITLKQISFAGLRGDIQFGQGPALTQAATTGGPFASDFSGITFPNKRLYFTKNGMQGGGKGYVYLSNANKKKCYAIGISSLAGVVVMKMTCGEQWKTM